MSNKYGEISVESEARIRNAVVKIADLVDAGSSPTEALAKAASDCQLQRGHVPIAARVYNASQSEMMRLDADDLLCKAAEFPLADAEAALKIMFPEKQVSLQIKRASVSADYSRRPQFRGPDTQAQMAQTLGTLKKQASVTSLTPPPPDLYGNLLKAQAQLRVKQASHRKAQEEVENARAGVKGAMVSFCGLAKVAEAAAYAMFAHGPEAVEAVNSCLDDLADWAVRNSDMSKVRAQIDRFAKAAADLTTAKTDLASSEVLSKEATEAMYPTPQPPVECDILGELPAKSAAESEVNSGDGVSFPVYVDVLDALEKSANVLAGAMGTTMAREIGSKFPTQAPVSKLEDKMYKKLTDPLHEQELANIQTQATLNRLLTDDDNIIAFPYDQVSSQYNDLVKTMPHAVGNPEILRAFLRRRLDQGGAADPQDVEMMLKVDRMLQQRDNPGNRAGGGGVADQLL